MRFSLIMILILVLGMLMGMSAQAAPNLRLGFDDSCSAKEAYDRGYEGAEVPYPCRIGEASIVHEFWHKGKEAKLKKELAAQAEQLGKATE